MCRHSRIDKSRGRERGSVKHVICKNNSRESQNTGTEFHNRRFKNFLFNGRKAEFKINSTCF